MEFPRTVTMFYHSRRHTQSVCIPLDEMKNC
jgi:hypothetical protein